MTPNDTTFFQELSAYIAANLPEVLMRLLLIVVVLLAGRWLAGWISRVVERLLSRHDVHGTARNFVTRSVYVLVIALVLLIVLGLLGIPTTSIIAVLGAGTLAIGLALRDSLSNLASGLLLVFLKPFTAGESVRIGSDAHEGTVVDVGFFHTELDTADNRVLLVPNADIMANAILNHTRRGHRRIDLIIGIGYDQDIRRAKAILAEVVAADSRVLADPPARIAVSDLGEASVNLSVRPFVRTADHDAVRADLLEQIKLRFDEAGLVIYPQRALRLVQDEAVEGQAVKKARGAGDIF